jgi:hypothetical protein
MNESTPSPLNNVITIDDERIKNHLDRLVRGRVEETLNALLRRKRTAYAMRNATSAAMVVGTRATMNASCRPSLARCG